MWAYGVSSKHVDKVAGFKKRMAMQAFIQIPQVWEGEYQTLGGICLASWVWGCAPSGVQGMSLVRESGARPPEG